MQQKIDAANAMIAELDKLENEYDFGITPYHQGKIKANLGEKTAAIKYLSIALDDGIKFQTGTTFQYDPDLIVLKDDPDYIKLVTRNRQL